LIAIVSDIHANVDALQAALADMESKGVDEIYNLGDVIDYGPQPQECLDVAMERFKVNILGNHEEATLNIPIGFNPVARKTVEWTRNQLRPGPFSSGKTRLRWRFIQQLPRSYEMDDILLVHGSPRDPTMEYIMKSDTDDLLGEVPEKIVENLALIRRFAFCGHSHMPGVVTDEGVFYAPEEIDMAFPVEAATKLLVNVGSVGQPRDRDSRACYVTLDDKEVRYHRVEYDIQAAVEKVHATPGLEDFCGDRLLEGR